MGIKIDLCLGRVRVVKQQVEDWQVEHKIAMFASDVDVLACECVLLANLIKGLWKELSNDLFSGKIDNPDPIGAKVRMTIEVGQITLKLVLGHIVEAERRQHRIEKAADFRLAQHELEEVAEEFQNTWPVVNQQMAEQSLAAYHRGEYLDSEDLLNEAKSKVPASDQ